MSTYSFQHLSDLFASSSFWPKFDYTKYCTFHKWSMQSAFHNYVGQVLSLIGLVFFFIGLIFFFLETPPRSNSYHLLHQHHQSNRVYQLTVGTHSQYHDFSPLVQLFGSHCTLHVNLTIHHSTTCYYTCNIGLGYHHYIEHNWNTVHAADHLGVAFIDC